MGAMREGKIVRLVGPQTVCEEEVIGEPGGGSIAVHLIARARQVLDDAETKWAVDHGTVMLRDSFCLLRNYLDQLGRYVGGGA
jgi:hypothetical protein